VAFVFLSPLDDLKIETCATIILSVALYGCGTWSLTLKEEHRLSVFENEMLRRLFGPKREEMARGWRRNHNEELHNAHSSPNMLLTYLLTYSLHGAEYYSKS
jgi:hypothetical protein